MNSNTQFFKSRQFWTTLVFIIILIFGAKSWYTSHAIDPTKNVEIQYGGKNNHGYIKHVDQYYAKVFQNVDKAIARKNSISSSELKSIQTNKKLSGDLTNKAKIYHKQVKDVSVHLSKTKNLKNEEQIELTVKTKVPNLPVKNVDQTITVSGLPN